MDFFFHVGAHAGYHVNDYMSSDSSSTSSSSSSESSANSSDSSMNNDVRIPDWHGEYDRITPKRERDKNDPFRHHHDYDDIQLIKNNDESLDDFSLSPASAEEMDDTTCELLGRYVSSNWSSLTFCAYDMSCFNNLFVILTHMMYPYVYNINQ